MGSKERKPRSTLTGRCIRGRRFDRNPLRRAADRAETVALVLLLVAFLVGAPLAALASGAWAHTVAQRAELAQAASRHQVTAVVLTTAAAPTAPTIGSSDQTSVVRARWTAPDGTVVKGEMPVLNGTRVGATVPVWATRDGQLTSHPMSDSQVASLADLGEIVGATAVALLLALVGVLARRSLDKRRMAAWDADWQATGPRWTTRA